VIDNAVDLFIWFLQRKAGIAYFFIEVQAQFSGGKILDFNGEILFRGGG
jgi:hypothetical protein